MDIVKLEGIISAIESESRNPAPSHSNLARLVAMVLRELISGSVASQQPPAETFTDNPIQAEIEDSEAFIEPKKKRRKSSR